jgi:serine/threonine-protein kinase RsbW
MESKIRLIVPAESRHVRLIRLTAAGVAADAGLDVDDVEDVRVAVTELFALLVDDEENADDSVEVGYRAVDDGIAIDGRRSFASDHASAPAPDDLALDILRVIVDEHDFKAEGGVRTFALVKRRAQR